MSPPHSTAKALDKITNILHVTKFLVSPQSSSLGSPALAVLCPLYSFSPGSPVPLPFLLLFAETHHFFWTFKLISVYSSHITVSVDGALHLVFRTGYQGHTDILTVNIQTNILINGITIFSASEAQNLRSHA